VIVIGAQTVGSNRNVELVIQYEHRRQSVDGVESSDDCRL
jgi:hypothetical protein